MSAKPNYYQVLGVDPEAPIDMIRAAFAAAIDKFPQGVDANQNSDYRKILQAYKVLSNPKRRAVYDSLLSDSAPFALRLEIQASRDRLDITDSAQLLYLLVEIFVPEQEDAERPLNLCLVIDRSTSMKGARLSRVISAIEMILERLGAKDILSVISFSDRAEVVSPAGQVENIHLTAARIRSMEASGGTEIYQGLSAGVDEMQKVPLTRYTNHLILLTDGHTYGDVQQCLALAKDAASKGITFGALGLGTEWNDEFLDELVAPSSGHSVFIESPADIVTRLKDQINGLGQIHARNVRLLRQIPDAVTLKYGFKLAPFAQPLELDTDQVKLGDIEGKAPLSFLLELSVAPQRAATNIDLPLNLLADIPSQATRNKAFGKQFQVQVIAAAPRANPPPALVKAVRMLNMYRLNEKVWDEVESGQIDQAASRMQRLSTRLLEIGETDLAMQAHAETQRLSRMGTLSPEGRKRLKYGTRGLLNETMSRWDKDD